MADVSIAEVIGGAERTLFEQSTKMSERGHNVHVLTRRLPGHENDHTCIQGVNEWRYDCHQRNAVAFLQTTLLNSKKLYEFLQKNYHFDCINFHQPFSALGINLSEMSRKTPKIYTCHSLSFEEFLSRNRYDNGIFRKAKVFFQRQVCKKIEKYSLNKSEVIVVLSKFTEDKLVDVYNIPQQKIETIAGGVDLERFHPANNKTDIRKQLNIPQDKVILFTVRNLVQRMGLENLIIAFHELKKVAADTQLVIGGKGPLENGLIALTRSFGIEQEVHLSGFIPEEQLPLYYQMADLFVLPTKELEGFGLVTLEAMASGLPIIGTPVGGTKEIIGNFDSSFLFNGTDPHSMAELIIENYQLIKHNPQKWEEISHRFRNYVELNYSWEKNIDALEEILFKTSKL